MAVQPLTRTPPVLLAPAAADDVLLLRRQLCSLQLALESRETAIDDFRSQTETILWSVGPQVSLFPQNLPCIAYLKDAAGRYIFVNQLWEKVHQKSLEGWYKKTDGELFQARLYARVKGLGRLLTGRLLRRSIVMRSSVPWRLIGFALRRQMTF